MFLLNVWNELAHRGIEYKLVLAGRHDDTYHELKNYVHENSLVDSVLFLGAIDDVFGLLNATDVFVFSTKSEGSPNAVIEACMSGLPVIANNLEEIREVVSPENYDYLFDKGDIEQVVSSLMC